ncbi:NADH-quinone oxidoreductase subunit C [Maridesulfovibrio bastinii]|uniref:NADH-quinone oxidoreductase subunit C n=1 Tax=Maridesulfovibrio bastinii TaxID=47157 RepID=UPI0003FB7A43|nr:NADH-quinone oxidoreductase subunit C [Maridesulfovibrio bastinii]
MLENLKEITLDTVVGEASKMKTDGQRFVTMTCTELDAEYVDILYHFDKDEVITNFRLKAQKDVPVPSISGVFLSALLVENEIQDQFAMKFEGLAIDFGRTLYLDAEITTIPLCNNTKAMTVKK